MNSPGQEVPNLHDPDNPDGVITHLGHSTGEEWGNNTRKNEGMELKQKQHPVVDGTGNRASSNVVKSNIA